jgi:hypothetical protein
MNRPIFIMSFILSKYRKKKIEKDKKLFQLSFELLKNLGYEVHFYGDDFAIKEFCHIPWDYKDNILEKINKNYYQTWSIGKLFSIQEACKNYEKFFHIDGDIFIFNHLPNNLLNNTIICFDREPIYNFNNLYENCKFVPNELRTLPKEAYNMSFFGGPSILIKNYIDNCLNFVLHKSNKDFFQSTTQINTLLAILAEQGYFSCYANFYDLKVKTIKDHLNLNEVIQHIRLQYSKISIDNYSNIDKLKNIIKIYNQVGGIKNIEYFDKIFSST